MREGNKVQRVSGREMETEETIEVRKQDGWVKPGSMGRYGCRLFSAQSLSDGLLSYVLKSQQQETHSGLYVCMCGVGPDKYVLKMYCDKRSCNTGT